MPAFKRTGRRFRKTVKTAVRRVNKGAKKARSMKAGKKIGSALSKSSKGRAVVKRATLGAKKFKSARAMIRN